MRGRLDAARGRRHIAPPAVPVGLDAGAVFEGRGVVSIFGEMRQGVGA